MVARGYVVGCKEYCFGSCKVDFFPNYFTICILDCLEILL